MMRFTSIPIIIKSNTVCQILFHIIILQMLVSCNVNLTDVSIPQNPNKNLLEGTQPVDNNIKNLIEGIYNTNQVSSLLGEKVVVKWSDNHLTCFSGKDYKYAILEAGQKDNDIIFYGYWRSPFDESTGLVSMTISSNNGGYDLLHGTKPESIIFECVNYVSTNNNVEKTFRMTFQKALPYQNEQFYIIGHRAGGRNSDRLSVSENSLEMIRYAEKLGSNAIEIDVQLTKDKVPVLFHDEYMTDRLVNEPYFIGLLSNYTYPVLRSFCTLKNGEKIPTLEEALQTVIDKTDIKLVWLDVKGSGTITSIAPIQKQFLEYAKSKGRTLEILIGLPDHEYVKEFTALSHFEEYPAICELDENYVRQANTKVWAPRWSLGLLNDRVEQMHNENYQVFVWTIDDPQLVKRFIHKAQFDGICTNYPCIVNYEYYTAE